MPSQPAAGCRAHWTTTQSPRASSDAHEVRRNLPARCRRAGLERTRRRHGDPDGRRMTKPGGMDAARRNATRSGESRLILPMVQRSESRINVPIVKVSDVACSRVVATERREGAVTRNEERRPHRSDRAKTGRRDRAGDVGTMPKSHAREPRQDAGKKRIGRMPSSAS